MCFSATASFTAAAGLSIVGLVSLVSLYNSVNKHRLAMIALVPLLFAIQQAIEGALWLTFNGQLDSSYLRILPYGFLFFALIIWPIWIPLSLYYYETIIVRKRQILITVFEGIIAAGILGWGVLKYGVSADVYNHHIYYHIVNGYEWLAGALYLLATIVPFFIAHDNRVKFFGLLLALSCIASYLFWAVTFASVWCFFAAVLSLCVLFFVRNRA
ncbi:MAG: hypothetical protein M1114_03035 [Candidatus Dependentiae bacterium]|nr:hypothetical protein [Candidatus Dependentiae bacterium]